MTDWTKDRHAAARKACEAATSGPWEWDGKPWDYPHDQEAPWLRCSHGAVVNGEIECGEHDASFIAAARTDLPAALDEIERLTKALASEVQSHGETIDDRDHLEQRINAIADAIGDESEWSSDNDRGANALVLISVKISETRRLRAMLNSIAASTTDPAIKDMALRALKGAER